MSSQSCFNRIWSHEQKRSATKPANQCRNKMSTPQDPPYPFPPPPFPPPDPDAPPDPNEDEAPSVPLPSLKPILAGYPDCRPESRTWTLISVPKPIPARPSGDPRTDPVVQALSYLHLQFSERRIFGGNTGAHPRSSGYNKFGVERTADSSRLPRSPH